ncbi:MAG: NAD(P)-binding domain-containing protein [Flavobacteriaceae bacterium]|jgi:putative flavoprotein involved in K+ transport|nr:NAD(P)-binding domain-containing protein [Flavobacteriaceae bacterium]
MRQIDQKHYDVVVVGAGQSGLSISYLLKQNNIEHIILERNEVASSWIHQRWDSFTLNTPNWMNLLPGMKLHATEDKEAFKTNRQYINNLQHYAQSYQLPISENTEVTTIHYKANKYHITICKDNTYTSLTSNQLVVASGKMSNYNNPTFSPSIPFHIKQLNAAEYKKPSQISGNVLIVGSGQSGVQIAEELALNQYLDKEKIYLATSQVARSPRRYRGKDMMEWLNIMGIMDMRTDELDDISISRQTQPQVSGLGVYGHTISLQDLHQKGVTLVGKMKATTTKAVLFADNIKQNIAFADLGSEKLKTLVDNYLNKTHQDKLHPKELIDQADVPDSNFESASNIVELNFDCIDTIIWAMGYRSDFSYLQIPNVLTKQGEPLHNNGISPQKGLYYLGFPWLIKRKSGIIFGITEDAETICTQIIQNSSNNSNYEIPTL